RRSQDCDPGQGSTAAERRRHARGSPSPQRIDPSVNPASEHIVWSRMALRKQWTWMGAFGPELMLCTASAQVGWLKRSWTAVWDGSALHEGVALDLVPERGTPIEASSDVA